MRGHHNDGQLGPEGVKLRYQFHASKPGELEIGSKNDQSIELSGLLAETLDGGKLTGKRWPSTKPVCRSMYGVANRGGAGLLQKYPNGHPPPR
jgi:hypothetical protein